MIELTRLNGKSLAVNCELIKYVESAPDTMLTLVTGEKLIVRESREEVVARAVAYRALVSAKGGDAAWTPASLLQHSDAAKSEDRSGQPRAARDLD